jgi:hypothetical protein
LGLAPYVSNRTIIACRDVEHELSRQCHSQGIAGSGHDNLLYSQIALSAIPREGREIAVANLNSWDAMSHDPSVHFYGSGAQRSRGRSQILFGDPSPLSWLCLAFRVVRTSMRLLVLIVMQVRLRLGWVVPEVISQGTQMILAIGWRM